MMDKMEEDFECRSDDVGMPTKVQPMDAIINAMIQEFEGNESLFNEVVERSREHLRQHSQQTITPTKYFKILQNNIMLEEDLLNYLIFLTESMNYHVNLGGVAVSDVLKQCAEQLKKHRQNMDEMTDFVGREEYIGEIRSIFTNRNRTRVVSICGMGGFGKTTLAKMVCRKMRSEWYIRHVDLREKTTTLHMLKDVVAELYQRAHGDKLILDTKDEVMKQLVDFVQDIISEKTLLVLDNIDGILKEDGKTFLSFLNEIIGVLSSQGDDCKMRIILTSRFKLESVFSVLHRMVTRFWEHGSGVRSEWRNVKEIELPALNQKNAIKLFKMNIREEVDIEAIEEIVQHCGNSPLAIVTISRTIRMRSLTPSQLIKDLQQESKLWRLSEDERVVSCLQPSFDVLSEELQKKMLKLSMFRSAPFDIQAAAHVLLEPTFGGVLITASTNLDMVDLKNLHMIEVIKPIEESSNEQPKYSLHPLMYRFLCKHLEKHPDAFQGCMKEARKSFVQYFSKKISDICDEMNEDCIKAQKSLGENRVHMMNLYEILEQPRYLVEIYTKETKKSLLVDKNISDMADILLGDRTKLKLLEIWKKHAKDSDNKMQYLHWNIIAAQKYLDMDRNRLLKEVLKNLESGEFYSKKCDSSIMAPVLGLFYQLKGRCCVREDESTEALKYLKMASHLYRMKHIRRNYRTSVANVYSVIGSAFYGDGKYSVATEFYNRALSIVCKFGKGNLNRQIPTYKHNLGTCLFKEGVELEEDCKKREARKKFKDAIKVYDEVESLDIQMNNVRFDIHAFLLRNRAEAYMHVDNFADAEKDLQHALDIRKFTLKEPHVQITMTYHTMGELFYRKGLKEGRKQDALKTMQKGVECYEKIMTFVKQGGLPKKHKEYQNIKKIHSELLRKSKGKHKLKKMEKFYKDFENGKFEKISKQFLSLPALMQSKLKLGETTENEDSGDCVQDTSINNETARKLRGSDEIDSDKEEEGKKAVNLSNTQRKDPKQTFENTGSDEVMDFHPNFELKESYQMKCFGKVQGAVCLASLGSKRSEDELPEIQQPFNQNTNNEEVPELVQMEDIQWQRRRCQCHDIKETLTINQFMDKVKQCMEMNDEFDLEETDSSDNESHHDEDAEIQETKSHKQNLHQGLNVDYKGRGKRKCQGEEGDESVDMKIKRH